MRKKNFKFLRGRALELGARDCKIIDADTVKTAAWVRNKCQFGCDGFGQSHACPPYTPTPEETQAVLDCFKKAVLVHTDKGSKKDISDIVTQLEKDAFFAGYYKAFAMGAGPCRLCRSCNIKSPCRHAYKARPSMEACGIDVFRTVRKNGFKIKTLDSLACKANFFGLVLVE